MSQTRLHHDFETFSELDLNKVGSYAYASHPSTEVLMLAYAFDDGPVQQIEFGRKTEANYGALPNELAEALTDPDVVKLAWNANFERSIWNLHWNWQIPLNQFKDPMVMSFANSFPGKLEDACKVLKLGDFGKKKGNYYINKFCKPKRPSAKNPNTRLFAEDEPEHWYAFKEYNVFDVIAERKIYQILKPYDLIDLEWEYYWIDQQINDNGAPINLDICRNVLKLNDELRAELIEESRKLTGLKNPNSLKQLGEWFTEQGHTIWGFDKVEVKRQIKLFEENMEKIEFGTPVREFTDEELKKIPIMKRVLELRQELSKTSIRKFNSMLQRTQSDGRARGTFQFSGAPRTARWAGRSIQFQNLKKASKAYSDLQFETTPKGCRKIVGGTQVELCEFLKTVDYQTFSYLYEDGIEAMSSMIRPTIQAPEGYTFIDCDYTAIENMVLGWLAKEEKILSVFRDGRDPYVDFATYLYRKSYDEIMAVVKGGDKRMREVAKPAVLGCGYQLGAGVKRWDEEKADYEYTGLLKYANDMGIEITKEQSKTAVDIFRNTYTNVVDFWKGMEVNCMKALQHPETVFHYNMITIFANKHFLQIKLPSGRVLRYYKPEVKKEKVNDKWWKDTISYWGIDGLTRQWVRIKTHPGKITENVDQAVARDILAYALRTASRAGLEIVIHVHDQIVALVKEDEAEDKLKLLQDCMCDLPAWAAGIPVKAEGYISKWFVKD